MTEWRDGWFECEECADQEGIANCKFALHHAVQFGDAFLVRNLIDDCSQSALEPDNRGNLPIHYLAPCGCVSNEMRALSAVPNFKASENAKSIARLVLREAGAGDTRCGRCGYTFLHIAVVMGWSEICRDLVKRHGADINALDGSGRSVLCHAIKTADYYKHADDRSSLRHQRLADWIGVSIGPQKSLNTVAKMESQTATALTRTLIESGAVPTIEHFCDLDQLPLAYREERKIKTLHLYYLAGLVVPCDYWSFGLLSWGNLADVVGCLAPLMRSDSITDRDPGDAELRALCRSLTYTRCTQLCIGLQSLRLPAFVTLAIARAVFFVWPRIPTHVYWRLITLIKHWKEERGGASRWRTSVTLRE